MSAGARFNAVVSSATVLLMFEAIVLLAPRLQAYPTLGSAAAILTSFGTYKLLRLGLEYLLENWRWAKKKVFGAEYLEGTWIGYFYGHANDKRFTVEYYEQDLTAVIVKGRSSTDSLQPHAFWTSTVSAVDIRTAKFIFAYSMDIVARSAAVSGITSLDFERRSPRAAPHKMAGFAHDMNDPTRIAVHIEKFSDASISPDDAFKEAKRRFT